MVVAIGATIDPPTGGQVDQGEHSWEAGQTPSLRRLGRRGFNPVTNGAAADWHHGW